MKILLFPLLIILSFNLFAQEDKTVTLTVSGHGKSQDEAKQNALRNAIEQAFGAFISSNTEILNDEIVKDEIVSVSNGNIQKFEIISEVQIPNGGYATSLKATVSVSKLTSFVESKGVVVEFKGSLLAANVKLQMLNEQNEIKSIANVVGTCKEILDLSCDFSIVRGEPKQKNDDNNNWAVPITVNVKFNKNIEQFNQYLLNSIKGMCMTQEEVSQYQQLGKKTYRVTIQNDYYFRSDSTILGIIDLINYTKHSILNFEITNGIDKITISSAFDDTEIIEDKLNPFINSRCPELFEKWDRWGGPICGKPTNNFRRYNPNDNGRNFKNNAIDISLADYIEDNMNIVTFKMEDILSLAELERVREYKITPKAIAKK